MDFQTSPLFQRSECFYVTISESFKRLWYFNFETDFLENENFFKKLEYRFQLKALRLKTDHSHTKLPYQKPMLRQIEW